MNKQKAFSLAIGGTGIFLIIVQTLLIIVQMNLKIILGLLFIACICGVVGILFIVISLAVLSNIKEVDQ